MTSQSRYLNREAVELLEKKKKKQSIWGWSLTAFFAAAVVLSLTEREDETLIQALPFYILCLLLSLLLLWRAYDKAAALAAANRYSAIFDADRDGMVQLQELTGQMGQDSRKVMKQLEKLFRLGLFRGCNLVRAGDTPGVRLGDASLGGSNGGMGFINVQCPSCGGTSRVRAGTVGRCDYCGSPLRGQLPR